MISLRAIVRAISATPPLYLCLLFTGLLWVLAVPSARAGQSGGVTLAGAPTGTTTNTNPEIQVIAPSKVSYRVSINGAPYSPEIPISTPIPLGGLIGLWNQQFTAGSRDLTNFLNGRAIDDASVRMPFFDTISFSEIPSPIQVTYLVNPKRTAIGPDNVLNLRGAEGATLAVSMFERVQVGPAYELSALSIQGGQLSEQSISGTSRQFLLSVPSSTTGITLTPQANNGQTLIAVNGQQVSSGQTVRISGVSEGMAATVATFGPDGSSASYLLTIHFDSTLAQTTYAGFFLRAFSPANAYVSITNAGADTVAYQLNFNGTFGLTESDLIQQVQAMASEYDGEPIQRKVWRFIRDNRYHYWPVTRNGWDKSPSLFFNSIGFGFCDDVAGIYYHLMTDLGYTARVWQLNGEHSVPEVFVNGRWEMYDSDLEVYYLDRGGRVAGVQELAADPTLITAPVNPLPIPNNGNENWPYGGLIASIYGNPNISVDSGPTELPPLDSIAGVVLSIPPGGTFEFPGMYDAPLDALFMTSVPSYANARLIVPAGFSGPLTMPLVVQSIGWSHTPSVSVITKDASGNWDAEPTVASWSVDIEPPFTLATQPSGIYNTSEGVTLTANEPSTIYYTVDGTTPTQGSPVYQNPVPISPGQTIRFFAVDQLGNAEPVRSYGPPVQRAVVNIVTKTASAVTFSATASGGSGSYQYMFLLCTQTTCTPAQYYSSANSWTWDKSTVPQGNYNIEVQVRNAGTTVAVDAWADLGFVVSSDNGPVLIKPGDQVNGTARTYPSAATDDGATSLWRLNDGTGTSAADRVGTNPGVLVGGVSEGQPGPLTDGDPAMAFNGSTGYVDVPNNPTLQVAGDLTIELWVNTPLGSRQTLISKGYLNEFELTLETNGSLNLYQGNGYSYSNATSVPEAVSGNAWNHIVVTRAVTTGSICFYVNSTPAGCAVSAITPIAGSRDVNIGRSVVGSQYVNGHLADIALYPSVLTPGQIAAHWAMRLVNPASGPVQLPIAAYDPDGDSLTYGASNLPPGLTIDGATGMISGTLAAATIGTYPVTISVSDGIVTQTQMFTWTLTASNHAPILTPPGDQTSVAGETYWQAVESDGPVGYWRLQETGGSAAADSMGSHPGSLIGAVTRGEPGVLADGSLAMGFDGATGYLTVPDDPNIQLAGDLTLELWLNVSLAARQTLISKSYRYEFELTLETDGTLNLYQGNGTSYGNAWSSHGAVSANVWHHVVVTRTASAERVCFYVDGVPRGCSVSPIASVTGTQQLVIGRATWGAQYVHGTLAEVAIYQSALTPAQIARHWLLRLSSVTATPVQLPIAASDSDGDVLTYGASGLPPGLSINPATGLISGTLTATSAGTYTVTITVSDGQTTQSQVITWYVTAVNRAPVFPNPIDQSDIVGETYAQAVIVDGPVGYWRLQETSGSTAADNIGGHAGSIVAGVTPGEPSPLADGSVSMGFDGSTGYLSVPNDPSLQIAGDLTIELWLNTPLTTRQTLASKGYQYEFELTLETDGTLNLYQGNGASYSNAWSTHGAVTPNTWHHVAVTRTASTQNVCFYVDGIEQGCRTSATAAVAGPNKLIIGATTWGSQYVNGMLAEVAIYSSVLTPAQIARHDLMRLADGTSTPVALTIAGQDADGDALTYGASGLPPGLTLNGATGGISGTLTAFSLGSYPVTVTVSDGYWTQARSFTWTVTSAARVPVVTTPADQNTSAVDTYSQAVAADGPLAYWRLGGTSGSTAVDEMGVNPGTIVGGVTLGRLGALADGSMAQGFDGASGYVRVPNASKLSITGDLTLEFWLNVSLLVRQTLLSKGYRNEFELTLETDGTLNLYQGNGTTYSNAWSAHGAVTTNTWHHVVVTRTAANQTVCFFVDGAAQGCRVSAITAVAGPNDLMIGRTTWGGQYVSGALAEVAIYGSVLTPAQIARHWLMRLADGTSAPVAMKITAQDPDGDKLTYRATGLPPGVSIDAATGVITGVLTQDSAGIYLVTVSVSDGQAPANASFTWIVSR